MVTILTVSYVAVCREIIIIIVVIIILDVLFCNDLQVHFDIAW